MPKPTKQKLKPFHFLKEFVRDPKLVGAVFPSSKGLARRMLHKADVADAGVVAELGPGTGSFTREIADSLNPDAAFFAIELNPDFVKQLNHNFPDILIYEDSAANLKTRLQEHGAEKADIIFSSIPWAILPPKVQEELFAAVVDCIKPGGQFITFAYIHSYLFSSAKTLRKNLRSNFETVDISRVVWMNIPPALVYTCQKASNLLVAENPTP